MVDLKYGCLFNARLPCTDLYAQNEWCDIASAECWSSELVRMRTQEYWEADGFDAL